MDYVGDLLIVKGDGGNGGNTQPHDENMFRTTRVIKLAFRIDKKFQFTQEIGLDDL